MEAAAEAEREKRREEQEALDVIQAKQEQEKATEGTVQQLEPNQTQPLQQQRQAEEIAQSSRKIEPQISSGDVGHKEIAIPYEILDAIYQQTLESRLALIKPLPEIPNETEENVLTYFDIREIHPLEIDMDADFSMVGWPVRKKMAIH
ncbi:unnamed protein product [Echinostoma caproni]|uniref:Uncharacterized protein n=1 Tax=Echinostoma caproni TaxID=27848 RepID=A0A3P8C2U8_9TREM|nr:unnamed protein product [Echinostoma caproni]